MAIRGCAAHPWQEEQDEPLSSVSGEMFSAECHPNLGGPQSLDALILTRLWQQLISWIVAPPLQLKKCRPLAVLQPLGIRHCNQPAATEITLPLKSIKSCSMVMLHLCCMTKVQTVKSFRVSWLWMICSFVLPWYIENQLQIALRIGLFRCVVCNGSLTNSINDYTVQNHLRLWVGFWIWCININCRTLDLIGASYMKGFL